MIPLLLSALQNEVEALETLVNQIWISKLGYWYDTKISPDYRNFWLFCPLSTDW